MKQSNSTYSFLKDRYKNAQPNSPQLLQIAQQEAIATNNGLGVSDWALGETLPRAGCSTGSGG